MKNKQIKELLKVVSTPGLGQFLVQVLIRHDESTGCYDVEEGTEIAYGKYVTELLQDMKCEYEKQLKKAPESLQSDLEEAITKAKKGEY